MEKVNLRSLFNPFAKKTEKHEDELFKLIAKDGIEVLAFFVDWGSVEGCEKEDFAKEVHYHARYSLEGAGCDHRYKWPFNNDRVADAVRKSNPFCAENWFRKYDWYYR